MAQNDAEAVEDLSAPDFSKAPTDAQLLTLAKHISPRWKDLARVMLPLRIPENEIEEITKKNPDSISEQCIGMLTAWQSMHGSKGIIECLVKALNNARCKHAAEIVFGTWKGDPDESVNTRGRDYTTVDGREDELYELARDVGANWPEVASSLGINGGNIDIIKADVQSTNERSYKMLHDWYLEHGSGADLSTVRQILDGIRRDCEQMAATPGEAKTTSRHYHVLVLSPTERELQATLSVFETESGRKVEVETFDSSLNLRVIRNWNSTRLDFAFDAQPETGERACFTRLSELARNNVNPDLVVMTGACAGVEDVDRCVEYGTVVVARRAVIESGKALASRDCAPHGDHAPYGDPVKLDHSLMALCNTEIESAIDDKTWLDSIPDKFRRPSPRYAQELILEKIFDKDMSKRELCQELMEEDFPGMTKKWWDAVLKKMLPESGNGMVCIESGKLKVTEKGNFYRDDAFEFPRKDEISVIMESVGSVRCPSEKLPDELPGYVLRMSDYKLTGIDLESHVFMTDAKTVFPDCLPMVIKGIENYGTPESTQAFFQEYAAATPAAFLKRFLTRKHVQDTLASKFGWNFS